MDKICFDRHSFYTYLFILILILLYFIYYYITYNNQNNYIKQDNIKGSLDQHKDKIILNLKDQLYNIQLQSQKCQQDLISLKMIDF
jgi:amino acid permease